MTTTSEPAVIFGDFKLYAQSRALLREQKPVRLGSRAFDILALLVSRAGEIVSKEELIAHVWPNTFVEESNLRVHLAALQKVLGVGPDGRRRITNIVGRGYSFIDQTIVESRGEQVTPPPSSVSVVLPLPATTGRLIGRSEIIQSVSERVLSHRLVTICGAPGIGKTAVALVVAESVAPSFGRHVHFIDLAAISDPTLALSAVATALKVPVVSENVFPSVLESLSQNKHLLVLDNCEHVINAAATLCETILTKCSRTHLLTTSREPLRVSGERVQRLPPLAVPGMVQISIEEALASPAVELFVERARANIDDFSVTQDTVSPIADICRKLDGIPLAIEVAAARIELLGAVELLKRLEDRFQFLMQGRRTAIPRQQTLRATLDWSYSILPESEKALLQRLSIFAGSFSSEAAIAVAGLYSSSGEVVDELSNLAAKSLISVDISGEIVQYRLLELTRAYALEKLRDGDEFESVARKHAHHCLNVMREAEATFHVLEPQEWLRSYGRTIDDVRLALDWTFAQDRIERAIGCELTARAATLFFQLSLSDEFRKRLEKALEVTDTLLPPELEMRLSMALSVALFNTKGPVPALGEACKRALTIAESIGAEDYQLRALWGLARERYAFGQYNAALEYTERFGEVAKKAGDQEAQLVHARMMSLALHLVGRHVEAKSYADLAIAPPPMTIRRGHGSLYQYDYGAVARAHLARILWIQGHHRQALEVSEEAIAAAIKIGSTISLCNVLALGACPVAIWSGDVGLSRSRISLLLERASNVSLGYWHRWGRLYNLAAALWDAAGHASQADDVDVTGALQVDMLGTLHPKLVGPLAIQRARDELAPWSAAEVYRAHIVNEYAGGRLESKTASHQLAEALSLAKNQRANSWRLRCAVSLSTILSAMGENLAARETILAALEAMPPDASSRDVAAAQSLVASSA